MSNSFSSVTSKSERNKKLALFKTVKEENRKTIVLYDTIMVTEEEYIAYHKEIHNYQRKEMYYSRCNCPRSQKHKCTMDCFGCPYQKSTEFPLYDDAIEKSKESFLDTDDKLLEAEKRKKRKKFPKSLDATSICNRAPMSPESYAEETDDIESIIRAVSKLSTLENQIFHLLQNGYKNSEIINMLKIPRSTFYDKLHKIQATVHQAIGIEEFT